MKTNVLSEH